MAKQTIHIHNGTRYSFCPEHTPDPANDGEGPEDMLDDMGDCDDCVGECDMNGDPIEDSNDDDSNDDDEEEQS